MYMIMLMTAMGIKSPDLSRILRAKTMIKSLVTEYTTDFWLGIFPKMQNTAEITSARANAAEDAMRAVPFEVSLSPREIISAA